MSVTNSIETVTFTTKGQIVIPRRVRRLFEIDEGTRATVETTDDGILIKPVTAALIRKGRRFICLDELYDVLAAESDPEKNGVQWAVSGAKERGLIKSTKTQGFYKTRYNTFKEIQPFWQATFQ